MKKLIGFLIGAFVVWGLAHLDYNTARADFTPTVPETFDMSSQSQSIPWTVTGTAHTNQTSEGLAHWNSATDMLTIGTGGGTLSLSNALTGKMPVVIYNQTAISLASTAFYGSLHVNGSTPIDVTMPGAEAGLNACWHLDGTAMVTLDSATGDSWHINGSTLATGEAIDSPQVAGSELCFVAKDNDTWIVTNRVGTWVDGGAD